MRVEKVADVRVEKVAVGQLSITSTVLPLSGELCPGRVTFSCNSFESQNVVIDMFIDNARLVRYDFSPQHTYP